MYHDEAFERYAIERERQEEAFQVACENAICENCEGIRGVDPDGICRDCGDTVLTIDDIEVSSYREEREQEYDDDRAEKDYWL